MRQSRREFLQSIGCGFLSTAAALAGVERLFLVNAVAGPSAPDDYKALVCLFMFGGNDSNNTVVPIDGYGDYSRVRGSLAIPPEQLLPITPPGDGRTFGLHPSLDRLHALWAQEKVAIVTNVGPLIEPLTRDRFIARTGQIPYQLFSHSDQQSEWQTAYANGPYPTGWGGRTADATQDTATGFPTILSVAGVTIFSSGEQTSPLVLPPAPTPLNRALLLKRPGDAASGSALRTLLALGDAAEAPALVRDVAEINARAIQNSLALTYDPVVNTVFPATALGNQLRQIAKLIRFSGTLGVRRQIYFCSLGGFDTHANQGASTGTQATLLKTVSDALGAFHDAIDELAVAPQVTVFTMSDFSRTFKPAGSGAGVGTDHAWGSHQLVMGDAVAGADFYGHFPTLALGGPDDTDEGSAARGRWIPTTAVDQYGATLATWFGVPAGELPMVFPNIGRFDAPDLGFMRA